MFFQATRREPPRDTLLARYAAQPGGYTDCYTVDLAAEISLAAYVRAFYTTPLFNAERWLLNLAGFKATDEDAARLAEGRQDRYSAWQVEDRTGDELLMCPAGAATRSWFMVTALDGVEAGGTRMSFANN